MEDCKGRVNVSKDSMLFVVNTVLKNNIKESTTKENILKMIAEIYEKADAKEIIKLLPYKAYKGLEKLKEFVKENDDINKFYSNELVEEFEYLQEAMVIVLRVNKKEHTYSLNSGVLESLDKIFTEENRALAEKYGRIERLIMGMLYTYGVVEYNFFRQQICNYLNEIIPHNVLDDLIFKRLNLNLDVEIYPIWWNNIDEKEIYLSYISEDDFDIGLVISGRKARGLRYKNFGKKEIVSREEYLWDESTQEYFKYLKSKCEGMYEQQFKYIIKKVQLGLKVNEDILGLCEINDMNDLNEFSERFMDWYNNCPQYVLGGYSPNEMAQFYM